MRGVGGLRGIAEDVQDDEGTTRQAAAGVARRGAVASFSSAFWQEEEDGSALGGLGRYSGGLAPLVATHVRPGKLSLSSVF